MAMSIASSEEFEKELLNLGLSKPNLVPSESVPELVPSEEIVIKQIERGAPQVIVETIARGRPEGCLEIPSPVREFIAQESLSGTSAKDLAELTSVSPSSISAYKVGATSTASYNKPDPELDNHVKKIKISIAAKARGKLLQAIDSLTPDKISNAKAKDIAGIAKDMAAVVKHLDSSESDNSNQPNVQFVFFAPKVKEESSFPIIEVAD